METTLNATQRAEAQRLTDEKVEKLKLELLNTVIAQLDEIREDVAKNDTGFTYQTLLWNIRKKIELI